MTSTLDLKLQLLSVVTVIIVFIIHVYSINMLYIYVSIDTFTCYATLTYHLCHIGNISCAMSCQAQSSSLCHLDIPLFCHIGMFIIILPLDIYICYIDKFIIIFASL